MDVGCQWGVGFGVGVRGVAALRSGGCWRRGAAVNDNAAVAVATAMMLRRSPVRSEDSDRNREGGGGGVLWGVWDAYHRGNCPPTSSWLWV